VSPGRAASASSRKKAELDGLTGMDAEQADWEEGLEEEDGD
jgi:hypothetical protein